jgi:Co/Zn/Cd efflux system component
MIYLTIGAFIINLVVLILLIKYKTTDKGFTTALFFSSIDVYQNLATIIAAVIIKYTNSIIPDMVVGCLIFVIILISAIKIIIQTYKK